MGRSGIGTERREREGGAEGREQERKRGREWERNPQSKSRGLTGAKGGWWVRADQGVWDAKATQSSIMVKYQCAIAPLEHRRDTSLRVGKPKHGKGRENAAHERALDASGHVNVGGLCTHGVVLKRQAPRTVQQ